MATINIFDLQVGTELFSDSESYLNDLIDSEVTVINGGLMAADQTQASTYICSNCVSISITNSPFCTQNNTNFV